MTLATTEFDKDAVLGQIDVDIASLIEKKNKKQEYLNSAKGYYSRDVASVITVNTQVRDIDSDIAQLKEMKAIIAAGCEPTTPNSNWFCGTLTRRNGSWKGEDWPCANDKRHRDGDFPTIKRAVTEYVFRGPVPVSVLAKYEATRSAFESIRVYSPHKTHFTEVPEPVAVDPVLIGRVRIAQEWRYFEIARWDMTDDLNAIFG